MNKKEKILDYINWVPLNLGVHSKNQKLATATGFVVEGKKNEKYLITNWHVLSGINLDSNEILSKTGLIPDSIIIVHHHPNKNGIKSWIGIEEILINDDGSKKWVEHPNGRLVDVVALPLLKNDEKIVFHSLNLDLANEDMIIGPGMTVSIVGFPIPTSKEWIWPIWKTGHIATEPEMNYRGLPNFLIDATTRGGMSGSPVFARVYGTFISKSGIAYMSSTGFGTKFLGIYSSRLNLDNQGKMEGLELGRVWKPNVISEILGQL